jgi:hypothetical protein
VILRVTNAIQIDSLLDGLNAFLEVINSELHHNTVGLTFASTNTGAGRISIVHSQFLQNADAILVSTAGGGPATHVKIADSHIAYTGNTGIQLSTANGIRFDLIRSEITFSTTALNLIATGVGFVSANVRDSTISVGGGGIVTSGAGSDIRLSLIRSDLHDIVGTAIDHGLGTVLLDGSQVSNCTDDFVNHGSSSIVSLGNNLVYNNINATPSTTYITPTIIVAK